jgi:hypothetical protein
MRDLENLRLEYYVELMNKAGDAKWQKSFKVESKVIPLKGRLRTAGPNQSKVIEKQVEQIRKEARDIRKFSSLDYDIAASLDWSLNHPEE